MLEARQGLDGPLAGEGEARLGLGADRSGPLGDAERQHDGAAGYGVGKDAVVVAQCRYEPGLVGEQRIEVHVLHDPRRGEPVWFGEGDVEGDRRGAHGVEPVDQAGQPVARPWPLAELGKGGFVDVDDPHGLLHVGAWR